MSLVSTLVRNRTFRSISGGCLAAAMLAGCSGQVVLGPAPDRTPSRGRVAQGPPAHAPAHGRRQYQYRYWSKQDVYFDLQNRQYIWFDRGGWHVGRQLPGRFPIDSDGGMFMETDTPLPWLDRTAPREGGVVAGFYE